MSRINYFNHDAVRKYLDSLVLVVEQQKAVEGKICSVDEI
jgi:hypothetical protein